MKYDVFFSISQTPVDGYMPDEVTMYKNFFEQLELADELGYEIAWLAQAHLSTEVQKRNKKPVVPHFQGEVGLCTDFFQLAHQVFAKTSRIEVGSAVISILVQGGPIAMAERVGNFCALHGIEPEHKRKIHLGFSAGRFEFMSRPYGFFPRDPVEEASWPALKGQIFMEASEIFLRLLRGDIVSSEDTYKTIFTRENFRSDADWERVQHAAHEHYGLPIDTQEIAIAKRYNFEEVKTIPQNWNRDLLSLVVGSHDPRAQKYCNQFMPTKVFNLSITDPKTIDATHARMKDWYHDTGGEWKREYMPRTVMVFLNDDAGKTEQEKNIAAQALAKKSLEAYWTALQGTLDPSKVANATSNALVGSPEVIAKAIVERFDPNEKLMLWFDFFNHDSTYVCSMMDAFMKKVAPKVEKLLAGGK